MTLSKHDKEYVVLVKGAKALPTNDREKIVSCLKMYNLVELFVGAIPNPYKRVFATWNEESMESSQMVEGGYGGSPSTPPSTLSKVHNV